jgi:hypothetical protein
MESFETPRLEDEMMYNLKLTRNQEVVREWHFEDANEFLAMYFPHGKDIQFLGELKAPIKVVLPGIRQGAQEWASQQDLGGFRQTVHELAAEWAANNVKLKGLNLTPEGVLSFSPEVLHHLLDENKSAIKRSMRQQYGQRNGTMAYLFLMEGTMAMIKRYEKSQEVPQTVWLFPQKDDKVDISRILDWLFRRN